MGANSTVWQDQVLKVCVVKIWGDKGDPRDVF